MQIQATRVPRRSRAAGAMAEKLREMEMEVVASYGSDVDP